MAAHREMKSRRVVVLIGESVAEKANRAGCVAMNNFEISYSLNLFTNDFAKNVTSTASRSSSASSHQAVDFDQLDE
jgi:hypothetical protein